MFSLGQAPQHQHRYKLASQAISSKIPKAPKIPPILDNGMFVLNCIDKAKLFNDFFAKQCSLLFNDSVLPDFHFTTEKRIDCVNISDDDILSLIRKLNPNKASGSDGISGQMLKICDASVVLPLKIIFKNILDTSIYPDMWKVADVTPIFKKEDKQLVKNYRPISLLPICGKIFEKLIFNSLYSYLSSNGLITKNQSGFIPGDSCTNQLLFLINEIHEAFENPSSLEVRAVFLDISKAFDKVWHEGLIFKLKQNGVSGKLLKFFESYLTNRKQRVALNGSYSEYACIESGVPQGSVLGSDFKDFPSFSDLKKHVISLIRPQPKDVFNVFRPNLLRYLFQLRLGLSRLRHHKKSHNFADTPSDLCICKTGVEDTRHYLLTCPFYASHREVLLTSVENIVRDKNLELSTNSIDLFLYGDCSLSISENQSIISATLKFIEKSNRLAS